MYIESMELKDFRNYEFLSLRFDKGTMHREKQISLKLCIFVEQQSHIEEVKTVR